MKIVNYGYNHNKLSSDKMSVDIETDNEFLQEPEAHQKEKHHPPLPETEQPAEDDITVEKLVADLYRAGNKVEACRHLISVINARPLSNFDDSDWLVTLDALVGANCVDSLDLARDLLANKFQHVRIDWFSNRMGLRKILDAMSTEPNLMDFSLSDQHLICTAYRDVAKRLAELSGAKDLCSKFWIALFQRPSIYYAKVINAFDQHKYIDSCDLDGQVGFLNGVERFLAKEESFIFKDSKCWEDLNNALNDSLDQCFEAITEGNGDNDLADAISALVDSSIAANVRDVSSGALTPHGAVIKKIVWSIENTEDQDYRERMFAENIDHLLEWGLQEEESKCQLPDSAGKPECCPTLGAECRKVLFGDIGRQSADELAPYGKTIVAIYKRHKDGEDNDIIVAGISHIYPEIKGSVDAEFDLFFEDMFVSKGYPKHYYSLLDQIASENPKLYTGQHVGRLVARMGGQEEDFDSTMGILRSLTDGNPEVMRGRGQDYYPIAVATTDDKTLLQNVDAVNQLMVSLARLDEEEAERVVALMFDAISKERRLKSDETVNSFLNRWRQIAFTNRQPFKPSDRRSKIKQWAKNEGTAERAKLLLSSIGAGGACGSCALM